MMELIRISAIFALLLVICTDLGYGENPLSEPSTVGFVQTAETYMVLEGNPLTLTCDVKGEASATPHRVLWNNGSFAIAMGAESAFPDEVAAHVNGNRYQITILSAQLKDEGEYSCSIFGAKTAATHSVTVNIPATIIRGTSDLYEINIGDSIEIPCTATGKPQPNIQWKWLNGSFNGNQDTLEAEILQINYAEETSGGIFECRATNIEGMVDVWPVQVDVLYAPQIDASPHELHTGPGDDVTLECSIRGGPAPEVTWRLNGVTVLKQQHITQTVSDDTDGFKNYQLSIKGVKESDIGKYTCYAENSVDYGEAVIRLTAVPDRLIMISETYSKYSDYYRLQWEFQSYSEPIECYLDVTQTHQNGTTSYFGNVTVPMFGSVGNQFRAATYEFRGLEEDMEYEVMIQCRNTYDVSEESRFVFYTSTEANTAPPVIKYEENVVDPSHGEETQYVVDIGSASNTSPRVTKDPSLIILLSSLILSLVHLIHFRQQR